MTRVLTKVSYSEIFLSKMKIIVGSILSFCQFNVKVVDAN